MGTEGEGVGKSCEHDLPLYTSWSMDEGRKMSDRPASRVGLKFLNTPATPFVLTVQQSAFAIVHITNDLLTMHKKLECAVKVRTSNGHSVGSGSMHRKAVWVLTAALTGWSSGLALGGSWRHAPQRTLSGGSVSTRCNRVRALSDQAGSRSRAKGGDAMKRFDRRDDTKSAGLWVLGDPAITTN